jgi:hypothetical protein
MTHFFSFAATFAALFISGGMVSCLCLDSQCAVMLYFHTGMLHFGCAQATGKFVHGCCFEIFFAAAKEKRGAALQSVSSLRLEPVPMILVLQEADSATPQNPQGSVHVKSAPPTADQCGGTDQQRSERMQPRPRIVRRHVHIFIIFITICV